MSNDKIDFLIEENSGGTSLLNFLRGQVGVSHAMLCALKHTDGIFVNGEHATVRRILQAGDRVTLSLAETENDFLVPTDIPVEILYEDDWILAVSKPPHMPTHPSRNHQADTLANALKSLFDKRGLPFVFRAVNRLDADTSGVLLIAKNRLAASLFSRMHLSDGYTKTYIAFAAGEMPHGKGSVESYIRRAKESSMLRESHSCGIPSEYALTDYEVTDVCGGISVVRCTPKTGRTHQIRVHLASIAHPIVGDTLYGDNTELPRQALHAYSLAFRHPFTGNELCIISPLPDDMKTFFSKKKGPAQ